MQEKQNKKNSSAIAGWIFMSRWLQAPLYIGLIVAQGVYVWQFWLELVHLISLMGSRTPTETEVMLIVLGLIDVVMISNLLIMVIVGGWETFVSRLGLENHPDEPEWLSRKDLNLANNYPYNLRDFSFNYCLRRKNYCHYKAPRIAIESFGLDFLHIVGMVTPVCNLSK